MEDNNKTFFEINELCLPTASSQIGRTEQWSQLFDAYRRVAGVPGATYEVAEESETTAREDEGMASHASGVSFLVDGSMGSFGTSSVAKHQQPDCNNDKRRPSHSSSIMSLESRGFCFELQGSEIVLIEGKAGTGKSFLVKRLKRCIEQAASAHPQDAAGQYHDDTTLSTRDSTLSGDQSINLSELPSGLFAQGAFPHGTSSAPYSAFTAAFNDVLDQLLLDRFVDLESLKQTLTDAIGSDADAARLVRIVPRLRYLLDVSEEAQSKSSSLLTVDSAFGLRFVFRTFVESLCRAVGTYYDGPLVIFLDDAECMDGASAELLRSLGTQTDSDNLLIVLAVRSEMFDDSHMLHDVTKTIEEATALRYSKILVKNLEEDQVQDLVAKAIRREHDRESVKSLSDLVYQRTLGNAFFAVQFLRSLSEQDLLQFNLSTLQWSWQINRIQAETSVSDNVADLVAGKLQTLSKEARYVLVLASCLHSTIDLTVLTKIVLQYPKNSTIGGEQDSSRQHYDSWATDHFPALHSAINCPEIESQDEVLQELKGLVCAGLMEKVSVGKAGNTFKFAHERIRQAAQGQIPDDFAGQMLHIRVGELLRAMMTGANAQTWMLFACLDHLNQGPEAILDDHLHELVDLNLQAGRKAVSLSAFLPASKYFQAGIALLEKNSDLSEEETVLQLRLRTELSVCHYRSGNLEDSQQVAKTVVASSAALQDKLPVYYNLIAVYKAQGKLADAVDIGMELLAAAGEKFTKKPSKFRIMMETNKVQKLLKKYNDEQLVALPKCTNELKGAAVNVYAVLFGPMFHLGFSAAVDLLRLRSIYLTIKYGASDASALAFAYFGSHLISQRDLEGGYRFGKLSMQLLQKSETEELTARTRLVANFLILHWKDPLSQTLDRLMKGHDIGMRNGDIEMAFTCAGLYQTHYYYCGLTLTEGEKDIRRFIQQMNEYGQNKELTQYKPLHQSMLNLMGRSENPTIMTGDAMNQTEFEQGKLGVVVMKSYRLQLAYYFGDLPLAKQLMDELRPQSNSFVAPFFQVARRFFFALTRLALARKEPLKKQAALLKKIDKEDIQWIESRVRGGAINLLHKLLILKAEMTTFDSDRETTEKAFDKAIMTAGRSGFKQDEALANELAASYSLSVGDFPRASDYLTRAHELYEEWGAHGKVKQLEAKYVLIKGAAVGSGASSAASGSKRSRGKSHMGRQRFSQKFSDSHKFIESSAAFSTLSVSEEFSVNTSKDPLAPSEKKLTGATAA